MSVVLFIFKLIGSILLALLGVILLLVLLVLFVPVRYHVFGQIEDELTIHVRAGWLLHLISFHSDYEGEEFALSLRILGIRVKAKKKSVLEEEEWEDEEQEQEQGTEERLKTDEGQNADKKPEAEKEPEINKKPGNKVKTTQKISKVLKQASSLKETLTDEANQTIFIAVLAELKYLLRHFRFRKLITDLRFSLGDPAATGQALGILSMFPILYQYQVGIMPDFESEALYVKGTFEIKGRMRVVHFMAAIVRLWKRKEVRIFVKKLLDR